MVVPADPHAVLRSFRAAVYGCLGRRRDALFELADALLVAGPVLSPVHLSLEAVHRRGWGSLYAALSHGEVDADRLRALLAHYPLSAEPPVYAVDVSVWPRCDAEANPKRGHYYHPSRHSAGQPIVAGWAYQWVAQLGLKRSTADVAEEAGHAYKDVEAVMRDSADLVEPLYRLRPLGVMKG